MFPNTAPPHLIKDIAAPPNTAPPQLLKEIDAQTNITANKVLKNFSIYSVANKTDTG